MLNSTETDNIRNLFKNFNEEYTFIYSHYKTLAREDLRLQSGLLHDLFKRLYQLKLMFNDIKDKIDKLKDEGLKFTFEDSLLETSESMSILEHCINNAHIKNNWVRVRVWYSGFFNETGAFSSTSLIGTAVSFAIDATKEYLFTTEDDDGSSIGTKTNVGHVTIELLNGYFSFWPPAEKSNDSYTFNTLKEDKSDEGTTLEHQRLSREPDKTFEFYSLDVNKMDEFCRNYVRDKINYNFLSKKNNKNTSSSDSQIYDNCISSCLKILMAGEINALASNGKFVNSLSGVVTPRSFAECLAEAKRNEESLYPITKELKAPMIDEPRIFKAGTTPLLVNEDYQSANKLHLTAKKNDVIILEKINDDSNYLHCRDKNNKHGLIHAGFVSFKTAFDAANVVNGPATFSEVLNGLTYVKIEESGACLFQAIGLAMGQNATFIRNMMAHYLKSNFDICRKFRPGKKDDFEKYINDIRNGNEWNDLIELQIIQSFSQRPIIVIRPEAEPLIQSDLEQYNRPPIFLYYDNGHFDYFTIQLDNNPQEILKKVQACLKTDDRFEKVLAHAPMPKIPENQQVDDNNNNRRRKVDCSIV